jgi:capsular polysaccharide biosynthesis protein
MCPTDSLPLLVSERLSGLARWSVERHVRSCPACRAELDALQSLAESLKAALPATPSQTLDEKILSIRPQSLRDEPTMKVKERSTTMKLGSIPIGACLGLSAAVLITLFQPLTYSATGRLLIKPSSSTGSSAPPIMTLVELMNTSRVRSNLRSQVGGELPKITIKPIEKTQIIVVTAMGDNPKRTVATVNAVMEHTKSDIQLQNQIAIRTGRVPDIAAEVRIVDEATVPTEPISPKRAQNLVIGLVVGTLLGGLFGFVRRQ